MGGERWRHHMWWQLLSTMLLLATKGTASLCPARCKCNDDSLSASCTSAALEVVPIQLNPEVKHIDLSDNRITQLHFTISIYNYLITLNLASNKIKTLGSSNFESHRNLKHLNISRNEIEQVNRDSLKGLRALTVLDLSYNKLEELNADTFRELHSLQILKLTDNRLDFLEGSLFKSTKHLKELLLDRNMFLELPSASLADAINLEHLSLSSNLLKNIQEGEMPNLTELRTLKLDNNVLNAIHQSALSALLSLDHLDLSDNNFTAIPTTSLAKLSNITKLKLSGNFISTVPPVAFRGLFHLRYLKLDRQELLQKIDARAFVDNINLEKVSLDDNIGVARLPTRLFHGNPRITHLSIRNNRLSHVEASHFPLDQLKVLKLAGNPLECNCSLSWLWHLIQEQKGKTGNVTKDDDLVVDVEDIRCAGPEDLVDVLLADATESQVDCSFGWIAAVSATLTALFVLLLAGGLFYLGPSRRATSIEKDLDNVESRAKGNCANGMMSEHLETLRPEKMPQFVHNDYRALPPWDPYGSDCGATMNIYKQLDVNNKTRPHIVYV